MGQVNPYHKRCFTTNPTEERTFMESNTAPAQQPKSAMGIASLVLGVIALGTSFLPIINNVSAVLALLGAIFGIVGVVGTVRGKKSGKGIAIAALIVNVIAIVVVLAAQSAYSAAIKDATDTSMQVTGSSASASAQAASSADSSTENMALGTSVTSKKDLVITVVSVEPGIAKYDNSTATAVTVSYQNNGKDQASFNTYDWKAEDAQGAQRSATIVSDDAHQDLSSGTLAAGGSVTGTIYFDGDITKVLYDNVVFGNGGTVSWQVA